MKHGTKPTKAQHIFIKSYRLNPENWLVTKNLPGELHLVHRHTNTTKILKKD